MLALHQFDCARANKSTASWGVEARVPFLDYDFIEEAMMTNPEDKMVAPVGRVNPGQIACQSGFPARDLRSARLPNPRFSAFGTGLWCFRLNLLGSVVA